MKNRIIAITGQSGCGKSTLSDYYRSKSYSVVDCDEVAKLVHKDIECLSELSRYFGEDIIFEGNLDKKLLSARAFSSPENLQKLTDITHPYIVKEILRQVNGCFEKGEKIVFVDGAVIIGFMFEKYCDEFIVVVASQDKQIERLTARDKITPRQAKQRIDGQVSYPKMMKKADYIVNNNKDITSLIVQGEYILQQILKKGES